MNYSCCFETESGDSKAGSCSFSCDIVDQQPLKMESNSTAEKEQNAEIKGNNCNFLNSFNKI